MCQFKIDHPIVENSYEWREADYLFKTNVDEIKWTHLTCFFLIYIAEYMNSTDLEAHYSVYFNVMSCI